MNRKQRRAAAHAARKAERKAGTPATAAEQPQSLSDSRYQAMMAKLYPEVCDPEHGTFCGDPDCAACKNLDEDQDPPAPAKPPVSEARRQANAQNAQASTGPKTAEGKAKVAQNAVKTALTGRTVLLPFDDKEAYQKLLNDYLKTFQPVGPIETGLVQSLVDTAWRLERIPGLEYALMENEHNRLGYENAHVASNTPQATLELHIRQLCEKEFRNLQLQENRLMRRREREMKELRALQAERKAKEDEELKQAAQAALVAEQNHQPFQLEELGFEFSTQRFAHYMARLTPSMKQSLLKEALPQAAAA